MALSEIEKLERRYAENPQGLTFAPLAEVHRKNGEVQRALDLLGPGLQIHPDYIPASIVLGRCHLDLGDVLAAESAFLHVLALDGENVIALKALADIGERLLKFDDAERWLQTLLTVDRSNDDAREQLQRVEIARRQAEVASSVEPSAVDAPAVEEQPGPPEPVVAAPVVPEPELEPVADFNRANATPPIAMEDLEPSAFRDFDEEPVGFRSEAPEPPMDVGRPAMDEPVSGEPVEGLVGRETDSHREGDDEFRVETSEDIVLQSAGGSEFQVPDASQELFAGGARGARAPFEEDAPVAPAASWAPRPPSPPSPPPMDREPGVAEPPESVAKPVAPEPFVSEPFVSEPAVPEPAAPEPFVFQPPRETPAHASYSPPPAEPVEQPPAPPKRAYGVADTGGRSVAQLFKGILSARPPAQASAAPVRQAPAAGSAGAPTRPAADALSLSSVFGEEGSDTPPAVPAPSAGAGGVSFDDFFGSPGSSPATRTPRAPDPKNDDLDQFHAWLQNLKR